MTRSWYSTRVRLLPLAAAALWACSSDESGGPSEPDEGLPEFTAGDAQLSPDLRATIAAMVADFGDQAGAGSDPELAGVVGAIGAAFIGEGRITGVTASNASLAVGSAGAQARLVDGIWGVFGVSVVVFPEIGSPLSDYYTAVVALRGNRAAISIRHADSEAEMLTMRSDFPSQIAQGLYFEGPTKGWGALTGYMQVIGLKTTIGGCAGSFPTGVDCVHGTTSLGLEILTSAPYPFAGNTASGGRQFILEYGDVRGYEIVVYCDQASFC